MSTMEDDAALIDALVLEHLRKRGFDKAAKLLEKDMRNNDENTAVDDKGRHSLKNLILGSPQPMHYKGAYQTLAEWVDNVIDNYRQELEKLLFPIFAHVYLDLVASNNVDHAKRFFDEFQTRHALFNRDVLNQLSQVSAPEHEKRIEYTCRLRSQRYEVELSAFARSLLLGFIEENRLTLLLHLLNERIRLVIPSIGPVKGDTTGDDEMPNMCGAATAMMWHQLGDAEIAEANSQRIDWAPLAEFDHTSTFHAKLDVSEVAVEQDEDTSKVAGDKEDGKRRQTKRSTKRSRTDEKIEPTPAVEELHVPRVPLPPQSERVERDYSRDATRAVRLGRNSLPCVLQLSVVDERRAICTITFSNDCTVAAAGSSDSVVRLLLLKPQPLVPKSKRKAASEATPAGVEAASYTVNGGPIESPKVVELRGHTGPVYGCAFSRDDQFLVSCAQDGAARLWGMQQRKCLVCYDAHPSPVWGVSFAPIGPYFATCGHDRSLRVWSVNVLQPVRIFVGHASDVRCASFHPSSSLVASGSDDASVRVWDVTAARCVRLLCRDGHVGSVGCLAWSPQGNLLASGGDDAVVVIWQLDSNNGATVLRRLCSHSMPVWALGWSSCGSQFAAAGGDCCLSLWCARSFAESVATNGGKLDKEDAPGGDGSNAEEVSKSLLLRKFYTKQTPVLGLRFSRTNVLYSAGEYTP